MKYIEMFISKIKKLFIKEKHVECKTDEYCPIYLSYVSKYGEKSPEVKLCKNPNKQYCTKYRLVDKTKWKTISKEEKLDIIKEMHLIDFVENKKPY